MTWTLECQGEAPKEFSPAVSRFRLNKLIAGTEFIIDPLEGKTYEVNHSNWMPIFMSVLKKALIATTKAFKKNFKDCRFQSEGLEVIANTHIPDYFRYYFNKEQNLLIIDIRHPETTTIYRPLTHGGFQDIFFIPQITFGIGVPHLVDFILDVCTTDIDPDTAGLIQKIFIEYVNRINESFRHEKKIRDFLFLFFYKFFTKDENKEHIRFIFRFFLQDFFKELFKDDSEIRRKILLNTINSILRREKFSQEIQDFFSSVMLPPMPKTQQEKIQQQNLKQVNIFDIRDGRVLVEWRDFTRMPFKYIKDEAKAPRIEQKLRSKRIYQNAISRRLFTLVDQNGKIRRQGQQQQQQQQQQIVGGGGGGGQVGKGQKGGRQQRQQQKEGKQG
jgi:hypothetical protein